MPAQAIKPSREASRTEHRKSFEASRKHAANASRYRWAPEEAWVVRRRWGLGGGGGRWDGWGLARQQAGDSGSGGGGGRA